MGGQLPKGFRSLGQCMERRRWAQSCGGRTGVVQGGLVLVVISVACVHLSAPWFPSENG